MVGGGVISKQKPVRSQKLRKSAEGQECTVRLPGVCNWNPETSVLAHLPDGEGKMGGKGSDIHAVIACSDCHAAIDGRMKTDLPSVVIFKAQRDALARTHRLWIELGFLEVK